MGGILWVHTSWFSPSLSHTSKKNEENCSSDKGTEFILMRSRTATRWGEVHNPTRSDDDLEDTVDRIHGIAYRLSTQVLHGVE